MTTPKPAADAIDLEALSRETGVAVDVLRTLAGISDPRNERLFTAESLGVALQQASMVAQAASLQEQGQLKTAPVPVGVKRPGVRELRVKP